MKTTFKDLDQAVEHFKEIYSVLPECVIKNVIEYCLKNPNKYPKDHEKIDVSKPPLPKKVEEKIIEGAVEIYDNPDDPSLSIIKHSEGASLLSKEEADELQQKINIAIANQKDDDLREYQKKYDNHNKELLKAKLKELKNKRTKN